MAIKSSTFILVIIYFVFVSAHARPSANTFGGAQATGSDGPGPRFSAALDPKDSKVIDLGKFVVEEQNKDAESKLSFGSVLKAAYGSSGEVQRYALVIGASDRAGSHEYYAYVLAGPDSRELVAFHENSH